MLHCPASGDNIDLKLERCYYEEGNYFNHNSTFFREIQPENMLKMLSQAVNHPTNPIIGKYVRVRIPEDNNKEGISLVERFLETFQSHVHFLRIHLNGDSCPIYNMLMLTRMLPNLPNLQGLGIDKVYLEEDKVVSGRNVNYVRRELNKIKKNIISTSFYGKGLLKVDMLDLNLRGICNDVLSQTIASMFSLEHLKSFTAVEPFVINQPYIEMSNLLHLRWQFESNEKLKNALLLNCPLVRKMDLDIAYKEVDYELVFKVLQKFHSCMNSLTLYLPVSSSKNYQDQIKNLNPNNKEDYFTKVDMLQMPQIKSLTLVGECPPSFNFVCGLKSLEYLHLYFETAWEDKSEHDDCSSENSNSLANSDSLENSDSSENSNSSCKNSNSTTAYFTRSDAPVPEITDIIEKLATIWPDDYQLWKTPDMYHSNVWSAFPKLKSVVIARNEFFQQLGVQGWTFRRNELT